MPCNYAARHAAPSEGLNEEEQERQVVDNGEDIQDMSGGAKNEAMTNGGSKDLSRVIVGTLAGRLAKDLVKRLSKNHTGRRSRDLAKDSPGPTPGGSPAARAGMFARGRTRRLAGDLNRVQTRTLTGRHAREPAGTLARMCG